MRLRPLALGALLSAGLGSMAAAQSAAPAIGQAREFHGSFSLRGIYESNFARSSKALAAARGIKLKEYTLTPSANVSIVQPFGKQMVYLRGGGGYDFHRENSRLDRDRFNAQGGYLTLLGPCQAGANVTYRSQQSDLASIDTLLTKNRTESVGTALSLGCARATGIGGTVSVQRIEVKNSALVQRAADSSSESLVGMFGYGNPTIGRFGVTYAYSNNELPNRIVPGRPIGDGFFTTSYGLSAERGFGSRLTLTAAAGQTTVKREFSPPGVDQKFTSTTYSGSASYRLGDRITVQLRGDRAIAPAQRAGKLFDINTNGELSGRYLLGRRFVVSAGAAIQDTKSNIDTTFVTPNPVLTDSKTKSAFASVRYTQNERASLTFDVRHDDRSSNLPIFNYSSTRVGLTAEVGF